MSLCSINKTIGAKDKGSLIKVGNNRLIGVFGQLNDNLLVYKSQR